MSHYLLSTTSCWNLGDDLIREGVFNILNLDNSKKSVIWLNRNQISLADKETGFDWTAQWKLQKNYPDIKSVVRTAKGLILAGTPEWLNTLHSVYKYCINYKTPIYLVGVGMYQARNGLGLLKRANRKGLIKGATTRDYLSRDFLEKSGIESTFFYEPAFHANYPESKTKKEVVFGPLLDLPYRNFYRRLYDKIKDEITIISIHEPHEYVLAKKFFDKPVFFNSDYTSYKLLYSRTKAYIGGRSHGCVPVAACGGFAHIFKHKPKQEMLSLWANTAKNQEVKPNIEVHNLNEKKIDLHKKVDFKPMNKLLQADLKKHKKYWKECFNDE